MPVGVHLAVVDPGVGSDRRAVALRTRDGPPLRRPRQRPARARRRAPRRDRGSARAHEPRATASTASRGPSTRATSSRRLPRTSPPARRSTRSVPRSTRRRSSGSTLPEPKIGQRLIVCRCVTVDRFGNVQLNLRNASTSRRRASHPASGSRSSWRRALLRGRVRDLRRRRPRRDRPLRGRLRERRRSPSRAGTRPTRSRSRRATRSCCAPTTSSAFFPHFPHFSRPARIVGGRASRYRRHKERSRRGRTGPDVLFLRRPGILGSVDESSVPWENGHGDTKGWDRASIANRSAKPYVPDIGRPT